MQCYFGSMNWLWYIWWILHVVPKHSDLVLLGNMRYRWFMQLSCRFITNAGQFVFPAHHLRCLVRGRCLITLRTLVEAHKEASVNQIVLYAYGMKSLDVSRSLRRYQIPINSIKPRRWDLGIAAFFKSCKIPLFALEWNTSGRYMQWWWKILAL